jgi:hypothetical protein
MATRRTYANSIIVKWSKKERDLLIGGPRGCDRHLTHYALSCVPGVVKPDDLSFVDELEKRGYDITTLRFSVMRKEPDGDRG